MTRKKRGRTQSQRPPQAVLEALARGLALRERQRYAEALAAVSEADRKYPDHRDLLLLLAELTYRVNDAHGHLDACDRLVRLGGSDAGILYMRASALLGCGYLLLGLRTFQETLARFPQHPKSAQARQTVADLQPRVEEVLASLGVSGAEGIELGMLHERVQVHLYRGEFEQTRQVGQRLLARCPRFVPAFNNIAEAWFHDGDIDQAIAATRQALAVEPDNVHARGNLVRFLTLAGEQAAAREAAQPLHDLPVENPENWLKKAEAFSFLGDDQGVIDAWHGAEQTGFALRPGHLALLHHLAAVAFFRQGDRDRSVRLWRLCLEQVPNFDLARQHLDQLRLPPDQQDLPWSFGLAQWLPRKLFDRLLSPIERSGTTGDQAAKQFRRILERYPHLGKVLVMLLDRGDPSGRELAVRLAMIASTPELLAALRDFALGRSGSDQWRMKAAQAASEAGLIDQGLVRLWLQGQWREVILCNFEVTEEPLQLTHSAEVNDLCVRAIKLNQQGQPVLAEPLLRRALELEPGAPDLLNNLSVSLALQDRHAEADAITRDLHQKHPNYLFAVTGLARLLVREGKFDEARELLKLLLRRRKFHSSELLALVTAEVELAQARGLPEVARSWVEMVNRMAPNHPAVRVLRERVRERRWGEAD
jgi:tetratricopeptide (TPR) repeat protein